MIMYVALLRGINVGLKQVKVAELKKAFEELGFENVETLLASGNVVFEAKGGNSIEFIQKIEAKLEYYF